MVGSMSDELRERCLVLASGSPRRRELLGQLVSSFEVIVSGVPEPVDANATAEENVLAIARSKADAVMPLAGNCLVLAADTDVVLDGEILGKPVDADDARAMLRRLRNRGHEVLTAVVVIDTRSRRVEAEVARSLVRIRDLTDDEIDRYVATGESLDKAGGYAIQGEAASMIEWVDGCYTNVVGLPVCVAGALLRSFAVRVDGASLCQDPDGQGCPR
jgi:septum formation protein